MSPREILAPPEGPAHVPPAFPGEIPEARREIGEHALLQPGQRARNVGVHCQSAFKVGSGAYLVQLESGAQTVPTL